MIAAIVFVLGLTAIHAQNFNGGDAGWYCTIIGNENCTHHAPEAKCGTNGVTYRNMCDLSKTHCSNSTINQKHEGPCFASESNGPTTTFSPDQIKHGSEIILEFMCMRLSQGPCTHTINEKICATDLRTYEDFCEYEKARCTHHDLHVKHLGDCNA